MAKQAVLAVISTYCVLAMVPPGINSRIEKRDISADKLGQVQIAFADMVDAVYDQLIKPHNRSSPKLIGEWDFRRTALPDVRVVDGKIYFNFTATLADARMEVRASHESLQDVDPLGQDYTMQVELESGRVRMQASIEPEPQCHVRTTSMELLLPHVWRVKRVDSLGAQLSQPASEAVRARLQEIFNEPDRLATTARAFNHKPSQEPMLLPCSQAMKQFLAKNDFSKGGAR